MIVLDLGNFVQKQKLKMLEIDVEAWSVLLYLGSIICWGQVPNSGGFGTCKKCFSILTNHSPFLYTFLNEDIQTHIAKVCSS